MTKLLKPLAIIALLGFPIALLLYRFGVVEFAQSFKLIGISGLLAAVIFLVSLLVSIVKRADRPIAKSANTAMIIALIPLLGLGSQALKGRSLPQIHNISTDVADPPAFNAVVALRGENSNPHEYPAEQLAAVQQSAYPNIGTLNINQAPQAVFAKAVKLVEQMGWELVAADATALIIEATETTTLWQFKDDVVIRIRADQQGSGSLIDMRSVSRIGRSDLGANAARIEAFMQKLAQ